MKNNKVLTNPSRFGDMLTEDLYATGAKGQKLEDQRKKRIDWLRTKGKQDPDCIKLVDKLEECRPRHRCKSAACPECANAGQRLVPRVSRPFLKAQTGSGKIVCVTIVPADGLTRRGRLDEANHFRATRRWKDRLGRAGIDWFVGATDWSLNEHAKGRHRPRWSLHIYGFTVAKDPQRLKEALKKQFPNNDAIPRPVKVREWDGNKKALRYVLKPNFWRRVATDNAERFNKKTGGTRSCRATKKERLRSREKMELLVHIDKIGMQARLIMRFCQLINVEGTTPTIVLRLPKAVAAKK